MKHPIYFSETPYLAVSNLETLSNQ